MSKKKLAKFWLGLEASVLCMGLILVPCGKALTQEDSNNTEIKQYLQILSNSSQRKRFNFRLKKIIDSENVEQLFIHLKDKDPQVRAGVAAALGSFPEKAEVVVPKLISALKDENSVVRANAAYALARIGSKAKLAFPELLKALEDNNPEVRANSVDALGRMKSEVASYIPNLVKALKDSDEQVRSYAAYALGGIGKEAVSAIPNLTKALKDDYFKVRSRAVQSLGRMGSPAKSSVPEIIRLLNDENAKVRSDAITALIAIDSDDASIVPVLAETLNDANLEIRVKAAIALGDMGIKAADAVPELTKVLQNKEPLLRDKAAQALGEIGSESAVKPLAKALEDREAWVRRKASHALGKIGVKAAPAFTKLSEALKDKDERVSSAAADAWGKIAEDYQDKVTKLSNKELETAISSLKSVLKIVEDPAANFKGKQLAPIRRSLFTIQTEKDSRILTVALEWIGKNPWFAVIAIYLIFFPSLWTTLLWIRPLWLLKTNNILQPLSNLQLPEALGGWTISIPSLIFLKPFAYRSRVLDAWVETHIKAAQETFAEKKSVSACLDRIPIAVILDGKTINNLSAEDLQSSFDKKLTNILIWAEGGAGKTSLACQIAQMAMSDDIKERPCKHRMLPIIIEQELDFDVAEGEHPFTETVAGQLQILIGESQAIPQELVEKLLRQRKILVIIDRLSEMSEATRKQIRPASPGFPANALIVTSRLEESLDNVPKTTIKPLRVAGNQLSSFMEAYLYQRGKRHLFNDAEYFDACKRLSLMVGKRNITVLLAKLYAEQMISRADKEQEQFVDDLPLSIPDLMLSYLNELNRDAADIQLDNRTIQKVAKVIAWECLKYSYRPSPAKLDEVLEALGDSDSTNTYLQHLEKRLRVIQISEPGRDKVRFAIEPLAEYLAALHLVDTYQQDNHKWIEFINKAKSVSDLDAIQGFLLAVQDCCATNSEEVPSFVVTALSEFTGVMLEVNTQSLITSIL
ncbi:HEAT repeat-containing protein [Rivularia sp. PCC 7116]|uniref:HEAT repeat domain-containing protein n=1 Tax=Rivularia sp. PCC 7116 TaxID=373994 RepID=UPI00029EDCA9|nr:HEAT repeat domain-containing protein [Rivularia sp. PCC 7116]AFY52766.1 HEAT repeat-containing protein [Rivularia sp. PCC 7116]